MMRCRPDVIETIKQGLFYVCGIALAAMVLTVAVFALLLVGASYKPVRAQQNHHHHHSDYQNWVNKKGEGCCNNQDCGEVPDGAERETKGSLEVHVEGQWCPVLPHHYLRQGNVPNADRSHVCVWHPASRPDLPHPCQRLLCYQPRPLS